MKNKEFSVKVNDEEVSFVVRTPSLADQREGNKIYNKAFKDALETGAILRDKMEDWLKDQGMWDEKREEEYKELQKSLLNNERKLAKGGIKLSEAKKLAIEMQEARDSIRRLLVNRTNYDVHTAEGQADNAKFDYLVSVCVLRKSDNSRYFESLEDYMLKNTDPVAIRGAQTLASMIYGLDNNFEQNLPENKFLTKYKFMDEKLRLINEKGQFVNRDGKLVNEDGRLINDKGELIDILGNVIDESGNYVVESEPFLDDNDKPIVLETPKTEVVPEKTKSE